MKRTTDEERKARQYARQNEWKRENMKKYAVTFSKLKDAEIIAFLDAKPNKSDYIKSLIREDLRK